MAKSHVGTPNAPVNPTNAGTAGYVPVYQIDGTVQWGESAASAVSIKTPDGTTNISRSTVFNPIDYGAAGTINQSTLAGTESSGSTVIDLTTGQGTQWRAGHSLVIPWAGPAHAWASVTPTIGGVIAGGSTTFTCSTSTDLFTVPTYQRSIITGTGVKIYATTSLPTVGGTPFSDGDTVYLRLGTHRNTFSVHPTALDATNNTNAYNFDGAGSGTLSLSPIGATTYPYRIAGMSGAGGMTVRSSAVQTTVGMATLSLNGWNCVWWEPVSDGSGNYCHGYCIWGRSDDHFLTAINAAPNAIKITCQAGGWTDYAPTDLGKQLTTSGQTRGTVVWYDNATRVVILLLSRQGEITYTAGTAIATSGGEGAGTITGTPSMCYAWLDCGDVETDYDNKTWAWRAGWEVQEVQMSGTATGGTYVLAWAGYQTTALAYNASAATVQTAFRLLPGCEAVTVTGSGSAPNITLTFTFRELASLTRYGMADVPQIKLLSSLTGGTPVWTVATLTPGAIYNPGNLVLNPATSSGVWQECRAAFGYRGSGSSAPSFSSTLNTTINDVYNLYWIRANTFYPVTSPSAALPDAYFGTVSSVSSDALTVTPATSATVSAGTPVMHNDLPAWQAAWDAAVAAGGGTIKPTGLDHNWFTRRDSATEWKTSSENVMSLFRAADATLRMRVEMNGATARWRPFQVNDYYNPGSTVDDSYTQCMFQLESCDTFRLIDPSVIAAPAGEPRADGPTAEGGNYVFANAANFGSVGQVRVDGGSLIGFSGFGRTHPGPSRNAGAPQLHGTIVRYGGGGHDYCFGEVELHNGCRIEGTNGRWRSTPVYTNIENQNAFKSYGTVFVEPGVDGLRIRNHNAEIFGGMIVSVESHSNAVNQLGRAIYLESAKNARISGVFFNTYNDGIQCDSSDCTITGCTFLNSGVTVGGANNAITGNNFRWTGWVRENTSSGFACIMLGSGSSRSNVSGNTGFCEQTHSSALTPELHGTTKGINITGGDDHVIGPNQFYTSQNAIDVTSAFTGNATFTGGQYTSYDLVYNSNNESCRFAAGNGAYLKFNGVTFDSVTKSDEVWVGGTSSAKYVFQDCTFDCELELDAALTTPVIVDGCDFKDATQSVDFSDAATIITNNDFAVAPTLTGALLYTVGNRVAGVAVASPTTLGSGVTNDYALGIQNVHRITPHASGSTLGGIVARADGVPQRIINVSVGGVSLMLDDDLNGSAGTNRYAFTALTIPAQSEATIAYDATSTLWRLVSKNF